MSPNERNSPHENRVNVETIHKSEYEVIYHFDANNFLKMRRINFQIDS